MAVKNGFTLIEMLVVITLFSIIALLTTQALIRTIGNTSRADATGRIRENLEYAVSAIERSIRSAESITTCQSTPSIITYVSQSGTTETLECSTFGGITSLEQNNVQLTSNEITLSTCELTCQTPAGGSQPNSLKVVLEGRDKKSSYNVAPYKLETTISLRSY